MRDITIELTKEEVKDISEGYCVKKRTLTGHWVTIRGNKEFDGERY